MYVGMQLKSNKKQVQQRLRTTLGRSTNYWGGRIGSTRVLVPIGVGVPCIAIALFTWYQKEEVHAAYIVVFQCIRGYYPPLP